MPQNQMKRWPTSDGMTVEEWRKLNRMSTSCAVTPMLVFSADSAPAPIFPIRNSISRPDRSIIFVAPVRQSDSTK